MDASSSEGPDVVVLDGAMGTELARLGVPTPAPGWSAYALETAPELVSAIHAAYARAGAQVMRTNTFRTQPRWFPHAWRSLVTTAVTLAREAAREARHAPQIAGVLAPLDDCYRPDLSPGPRAFDEHARLAEALAGEGVDLLLCETFPDAAEAEAAVRAAVSTGLPTWVALTAGPNGDLMLPQVMASAADACVSAGAAAVLVNCTAASRTAPYVAALAKALRAPGVPFGAYANAGDRAEAMGWGAPDDVAAARYLAHAVTWVDAGASLVGACCGTGPSHIAALARRFGRALT